MTAEELALICGGKLLGENLSFKGFCIDSREVKEGNVFVALRGTKHDGHSFVEEAFKKGAVGAIVERESNLEPGKFLVLVDNSLEALRRIASYKRESFKGKVIGIAGSAGKTTTKELVAFLLSKVGKVCKTPKNYNSQIGVPLSVANFEDDCQFWVIEMGASKKGDVKSLVDVVKPHIRVITSIGEEHLETFGCLDDVVLGNGEIFSNIQEEDWGVIPKDVAHCYELKKAITFGKGGDIEGSDVKLSEEGISFIVDGIYVKLPIPSLALLENTLCAFGVLKALGYDCRDFVKFLEEFSPAPQRFNLVRKGKLLIIDDTYNANPLSVKKALESLSLFEGYKIAVLGDMLELGSFSEKAHREIGQLCAKLSIDECIFYGEEMRYAYEECKKGLYFTSKEDIVRYLQNKEGVVLVKGSRGMRMEEIVWGLTG